MSMKIFEILMAMEMTQYKFFKLYAEDLVEVTGKNGDTIEGRHKINSDYTFTLTINAV